MILADLRLILPEVVIVAGAIVLLFAELFRAPARLVMLFAIAVLLTSMVFVLTSLGAGRVEIFSGLIVIDHTLMFFRMIFIVSAILVIAISYKSVELSERDFPEYCALILGVVVGLCFFASSINLLMIYVSLEFVGLLSYVLVGFVPHSLRSSEAALKYVLFGAVASGVFLFGSSIFYGITGSLSLASIMLSASMPSQLSVLFFLAAFFVLAGFLFKIAAVPMQAWCPDAYEGAPTPIAAFLSVAPKAAGFAVIMRVALLWGGVANWPLIIAVVSAASMTFGNFAAITQNNIKRMLAYSSIAHAGYMLMGVAASNQLGCSAVVFYLAVYLFMNLGAFFVVSVLATKHGSENISLFKGLVGRGRRGVVLSVAMMIFLLSLTGIPPFAGFVAKFYIFLAAIKANLLWLAVVGIVNSVVSLYYYMRIARAMFFEDAVPDVEILRGRVLPAYVIVLLAVATITLGLAWQPLSKVAAAMNF